MKVSRRALLKGSLAAPAVVTLRPGSALAKTSAALCALRDAERAQNPSAPQRR